MGTFGCREIQTNEYHFPLDAFFQPSIFVYPLRNLTFQNCFNSKKKTTIILQVYLCVALAIYSKVQQFEDYGVLEHYLFDQYNLYIGCSELISHYLSYLDDF